MMNANPLSWSCKRLHAYTEVMYNAFEPRTDGTWCCSKTIDREVIPNRPIHWSRHAWSFDEDDENSGKVTLRLQRLVQNGRTILHSCMTLGAIDALAGVPSFHPGISNVEAVRLGVEST